MNSLPEKLTGIIFFFWRTLNAPSPDVAEVIMTAMMSLSLRKYSGRFILLSAEYEIYGRLYLLTAPTLGLLAHARIVIVVESHHISLMRTEAATSIFACTTT